MLFILSACQPLTFTQTEPKTASQAKWKSVHEQHPFEMRDLVKVTRVIDGDTIEVERDGQKIKVRLIGVNTPETNHPQKGQQPFGQEAKSYTTKQLEGKTVQLRIDLDSYDRYQRLLAYVYLVDGTMVNEVLIREGYAQVMSVPPNDTFAKRFVSLQREAREQKRGLWAIGEQDE